MALNFSYILVILGALSYSNGFKLLSSTGRNVFLPGELTRDFSMNCKADSAYEYCIFEHNGKKVRVVLYYIIAFDKFRNKKIKENYLKRYLI